MVKGELKCIYGNEIGIILGVNKNKNIQELYLEKLKKCQSRHENLKEKYEAMYWSNTIKEILCKEFTIRSGKKVRKELNTIIDEEYDFMCCKVDRKIVGENSILLCCVNSGINSGEEINENTLLECQHNMRVTKANKCYVACLINDRKFVFKEINRDEEIISKIISEEKAFFCNHILKEISPV
ncbi:YqaJ viral recombinase family protein [Clostridium sp.]|uniref:YqaJ viral recombinase family protein n=1 Tax=Clostridium sp. TaxID=1506 RepID=UPI002851ED2D|nr:YqaJ viral recombinase family protein [Clostridium sp.]MDR3596634.1 YqaJ viral recombinase family protein [Clostridium sp.]